ncbi:raftlin-2 isoform 1 [Mus musculus]|uniref:Raftlin-2 n=2 Tax=Mus musculus TaxID=10090 RepID=RFTN2_MOUSE|nr:raftlin-2 isoform 1 [Mus musculus]Q8CHX7.3 RecName: Full=Raftlin-2; AltName: Full=Raft-linking protein 2 [Mus musculus]AAH38341.1 Raftlin family member 2 [Mus musculus]EDL00028.1 mCG117547, isoform CRA_d [Mus musculus]|eukprot:NP_082989.1 raftlin-2 isoform 1 [Mus musculus]
MGCGLRKLEDPDESSPGKIFSTLKRPQVETKTEFAYEYALLDFTLQASTNPDVIKINSVLDIVAKVEDYYLKGYVVGAIHPVIQPVGQRKHLPASHLYRAVLSRLKLSPKHSAAGGQRRARLVMEECPLTCEAQANDAAKELMDKINAAAKRGMKFVGLVSQCYLPSMHCNGASHDGVAESGLHVRQDSQDNCKGWNEGALGGHLSESGVEEEPQHESGQHQTERNSSPSYANPKRGEAPDGKLYMVFNAFEEDAASWAYQEGVLSMKVTRKGAVISALDANWLELTTFYYKQGFSLIDSFVCWETPKGDQLPKSLEGFFIYEEEGSGVPGSNRRGNDAIVVEQWTVIEGCEIKTDYGPLLHTLAEFGWLLTSVLPTPILRHDSEGNLATKQVVFLQRPVTWNSAAQTPERKGSRLLKGEDRNKVSSRSLGLDTNASQAAGGRAPLEEGSLSPSRECWTKEERPAQSDSFSGFSSSDSVLRELDDGQFDQEEGVTQVTCM